MMDMNIIAPMFCLVVVTTLFVLVMKELYIEFKTDRRSKKDLRKKITYKASDTHMDKCNKGGVFTGYQEVNRNDNTFRGMYSGHENTGESCTFIGNDFNGI